MVSSFFESLRAMRAATAAEVILAVVVGGVAWSSCLARRRNVSLLDWVRVHWRIATLCLTSELEAQRVAPLRWARRLARFSQLRFLLAVERNRRFEVLEAAKTSPDDPDAIYKLHPLQHVSTQRSLVAASPREMAVLRMKAKAAPQVTDLVLIGGGHTHVHVLRMLGMAPLEGVRVTLIAKDVETPYSGMLPGHVAGSYTRAECHIDLNALARFAGARLINAAASGVDLESRTITLTDPLRPPIPFDVLSINVGIAPSRAPVSAEVTPVKPIGSFAKKWDAVVDKMVTTTTTSANNKIVVVGGGAGGVELVLAMRERIRSELTRVGKPADSAQFAIVTRGKTLLPSHSTGARALIVAALKERQVEVLTGHEALGVAGDQLRCRSSSQGGAEVLVPFAECVWCTTAAAPDWLSAIGLETDRDGFLLVDDRLRCSSKACVFAAGDCAAVRDHPRPKAGVFAVMAGMALYENIVAELTGGDYERHLPQRDFLGIFGLGEGVGVASRGDLAIQAAWLWDLKEWIDRKWMWQYTQGLPEMDEEEGEAPAAFKKIGSEELWKSAPMRCGGCGAKVGSSSLERSLKKLPAAITPKNCDVLLGVDAPDDGALVAYGPTQLVHTVDFFRSFIEDPYVFGQVAANHALSDADAMGADAATALAIVVVPHGGSRQQEDTLLQLMSGARTVLDAVGCSLVGGHTCEGVELSLGFAINAVTTGDDRVLSKCGMVSGDVVVLTKPIGTGVLFAADMRSKARAADVAEALASMRFSNKAASRVLLDMGATACTDVTGFGLAGHLVEMCRAAGGAKVTVEAQKVPLMSGALDLAENGIFSSLHDENAKARRAVENHADAVEKFGSRYALLFDPQTAGGLLATIAESKLEALLAALKAKGYPRAAAIGRVDSVGDAASFPAVVSVV